jgi:hypothetical protein
MIESKQLIWLLVVYSVLQLLSLWTGSAVLLLAYLIVYVMAIISGGRMVYVFIRNREPYRKLFTPFILLFIANLLLFLIYIPTILLNPNINWTLKGEYEQDPIILQLYVPVIFCAAGFIVLLIVLGITFAIRKSSR